MIAYYVIAIIATALLFYAFHKLIIHYSDESFKEHKAEVQKRTDASPVTTLDHHCPLCKMKLKFMGPMSWRSNDISTKDVIINDWWCADCKEQWRLIAYVGDYQVNYKPKKETGTQGPAGIKVVVTGDQGPCCPPSPPIPEGWGSQAPEGNQSPFVDPTTGSQSPFCKPPAGSQCSIPSRPF